MEGAVVERGDDSLTSILAVVVVPRVLLGVLRIELLVVIVVEAFRRGTLETTLVWGLETASSQRLTLPLAAACNSERKFVEVVYL